MYTCLLFLVKRDSITNKITDICLAEKKRGFGKGLWNGVGGKFEYPDTKYEDTVIRETKEELTIDIIDFNKVGELIVMLPLVSKDSYLIDVYICDKWEGNLTETEEVVPKWFEIKDIPYIKMWPDEAFWLPMLLEDKKFSGRFDYVNYKGKGLSLHSYQLKEVAN